MSAWSWDQKNILQHWFYLCSTFLPPFLVSYFIICPLFFLRQAYLLATVQDFLIKLGVKPHMHQWEISIFFTSWNLRRLWTELTKIRHVFRKQNTLKIRVSKKFHSQKLVSWSNILHRKKKFGRCGVFLMPKNDF